MPSRALFALLMVLLVGRVVLAQAPPPAPATGLRHLAEFGPLATPQQAEATFAQALATLTAAQGGLLVVPPEVPTTANLENSARWSHSIKPESNDLRDWKIGPGVMVLDLRGGTTRLHVPQLSDTRSRSGLVLNRTMRLPAGDSLQHWTVEALLGLENRVIHGPCNYLDWILEPVKAGPDARFYVPQPINLFKGMYLNAHQGPGYSGKVERITVKEIGYDQDKRAYYFTAHVANDYVKGAIVQNKSHTPAVHIENDFHASNQTFDFYLQRNQYGNGDSYLVNTTFGYMGNVHSMAGDENGNCYVAYIKSLTDVYRGKVKAVDSAAGWLEFTGEGDTLGQSRPIINLNPAKWLTGGTVRIVPAESYWETVDTGKYPFEGKTYPTGLAKTRGSEINGLRMGGLIRFSADAPLDATVIGRFFAVDEPTEYVPSANKLRRWYEITAYTARPDGTKEILIQRQWWGAKDAGSPTLYREDNYTWDGHDRPLKYIIAPGAYALDLREAVKHPRKRLGIAPPPVAGTSFDFAPGDDLEQAIGPDPFKPQAMRAWSFDQVPGAWPASFIELANHGPVQRDSAFNLNGPATLERARTLPQQRPAFGAIMRVNAAVEDGLVFNADVAHAALFFKQPNQEHVIAWQYGERIPGKPVAEATLAVSRQSGDFSLTGGAVRAPGGIVTRGLSADAVPAHNLRGKGVAVPAGSTELTVTFPTAEADAAYAVFVEQTWLANRAITAKTPTGFTVQFASPAPAGATLDWLLVR
jgi:hypothetical protein